MCELMSDRCPKISWNLPVGITDPNKSLTAQRKLDFQRLVSPTKLPQHASQAVDEVGRAEFFRKGGAARDLVRGKRWLLLSSWLNLDRGKRRQLNALFALNRRILKAYLLKESLSHLWDYRYEGAMLRYLQK
jgi:hypothetical protein